MSSSKHLKKMLHNWDIAVGIGISSPESGMLAVEASVRPCTMTTFVLYGNLSTARKWKWI
jgi:hypothetical protein